MTAPTPQLVCAELRDISGRLARFEPVDPAEIEAFKRRVEQTTGVARYDERCGQ